MGQKDMVEGWEGEDKTKSFWVQPHLMKTFEVWRHKKHRAITKGQEKNKQIRPVVAKITASKSIGKSSSSRHDTSNENT